MRTVPIVGTYVKAKIPVSKIWIASTVTLCPLSKRYISLHHRTRTRRKNMNIKPICRNSTLVEPSAVTVIGVATDVGKTSSTQK